CGDVHARYDPNRRYDAWGSLESGATVGGPAFTGHEWDPESGLSYYRARYYDPKLGRFLSEDPIGFEGGDANFYAYVFNNPTTWIDPSGLLGGVPGPSPTPTPSPNPPGRPFVPHKPGFWWWFFFGSPRQLNPCPNGSDPVRVDDSGPNLHADYAAWVIWKDQFIKACEAMGPNYFASCPAEGHNDAHGGHGQVTVCFCCKRWKEGRGGGVGGGGDVIPGKRSSTACSSTSATTRARTPRT